MSETVTLLTEATNYAVVQLPGRKYPGIVFQGDSLDSIISSLALIRELAGTDPAEMGDEIDELQQLLTSVRSHYEAVCRERGIELPYPAR